MKEQHLSNAPFLDLLDKPAQWELLCAVIEKTIFQSFGMIDTVVQGNRPTITQSEVKRRFKICEKWFRIMRADMGFTFQRTLDVLPKALSSELLGIPFDPSKDGDRGWFPEAYDMERAIKV